MSEGGTKSYTPAPVAAHDRRCSIRCIISNAEKASDGRPATGASHETILNGGGGGCGRTARERQRFRGEGDPRAAGAGFLTRVSL